jgi:hypothetical protein
MTRKMSTLFGVGCRHIRFRLQETTPHHQCRRESLVILNDTLCDQGGRIADYVDYCGRSVCTALQWFKQVQTLEVVTETFSREYDKSTFGVQRGKTMPTQAVQILSTVARGLGISKDDLLKQELCRFLERLLREVKTETFEICGRYGVSNVTEMDARSRDGTLEEPIHGDICSAWTI